MSDITPLQKILEDNISQHKSEIKLLSKNPLKTVDQSEYESKWDNTQKKDIVKMSDKCSKNKSSNIIEFEEKMFQFTLGPESMQKKEQEKMKPKLTFKSLDKNCKLKPLNRTLPPIKTKVDSKEFTTATPRSPDKYNFESPRYPTRKTMIEQTRTDLVPHYLHPSYQTRYEEMKRFREEVVRVEDDEQTHLYGGEGLIEHLELRLAKKLENLKEIGKAPNFQRLQIFVDIFEDIIIESWMFAPLLTRIKIAYDDEVERLLQKPMIDKTKYDDELDCLKETIFHRDKLEGLKSEIAQLEEAISISVESLNEEDKLIQGEEIKLQNLIKQKKDLETSRAASQQHQYHSTFSVIPTETEKLELLKAQCWDIMDEISSLKTETKTTMTSVSTIKHLKDAVQDANIELEKLKYQKNQLTEETDAGMKELTEYLNNIEMSERDSKLITSLLSIDDSDIHYIDYEDSHRWSWYIS